MTSDADYCSAASLVLSRGNLRNSSSIKLARVIALDRFMAGDPQARCRGLEMFQEFCLAMMNVKYFEQFKTMLD